MIKILSPINSLEDIEIISNTNCKNIYVSSSILKNGNESLFFAFCEKAKNNNINLFVKFKRPEYEAEENENLKALDFIYNNKNIKGVLINSISMLNSLKDKDISFKVIIDSGLNIHNMPGIDFLTNISPVNNINLTEEVYIRNLSKIKQYSKCKIYIDADNLQWIASDIIKNKVVDYIIIKGDLKKTKTLIEGIERIEKILNCEGNNHVKLPFKQFENFSYKTNHFSGEFQSSKGKSFKFTGNIQQFNWKYKRFNLKKSLIKDKKIAPCLNLKLTSLDQFKTLKKYIKDLKFNPVTSIEYGEILSTADLAKNSFNKIIKKIKIECDKNNIDLLISTPKVLIERDFDRVNEYLKQMCLEDPKPKGIVINNLGLLWSILNDIDFENINIELGQGLNFLSSEALLCLLTFGKIHSIDFSNFKELNDIKIASEKLENKVENKKLTIGGSLRIPASGLCPLNSDPAILSRLSCFAPCHHGSYAISDPINKKLFPITVDGFCRMHLFEEKVLDLFKYQPEFQKAGINQFTIDFTGLSHKLIPVLLNRFLSSIYDENYISDENFIQDYYNISKYKLNNSFEH